MTDSDPQLPATNETRVDKIEKIVRSLSDFEQDELRFKLGVKHMQDYRYRLRDPRNALAFGIHTVTFSGVPFGIILGTAAGTIALIEQSGITAAIGIFFATAIGAGISFGLFTAAYLFFLMKFMTGRLTKNLADQKSALFQVRELHVPLNQTAAMEVCLSILSSRRGVRIERTDSDNGSISALTSGSWRSPGEIVGVKVDAITDDRTRVRVYSKSIFTAIDFGKNKANVIDLTKAIQDAAEVHVLLNLPIDS